ncbi:anthranilate synthase component II [Nocardioides sp. Kera G14]|uniref:anthranilate synthase component II n=1 Tax=Nocardioides sp. Kera G14 TaxID=2884264 RepID=UPI001D0F76B0|nr:aminodeoxychorismate/anthranilate synthase component II [Nocardioides sp. Kera G14]UDY23938.1 aminodeoxychorismate/anthranilate synthase component II [Nocardioides sp. Kera G14]
MTLGRSGGEARLLHVLLVDNHDSYTFNLAAQLTSAGAEVRVLVNDDPALLAVDTADLDALVISPGPGTPLNPDDVGHTPAVLDLLDQTPVLGVCLGHQLLGVRAGAAIVRIEPHHGHVSEVTHDGTGPFAGLPSPLRATRYHSLAIEPSHGIRVTATAEDGVVMGLAVVGRPWWGVQFHPESIATEYGDRMVSSFLDTLRAWEPR